MLKRTFACLAIFLTAAGAAAAENARVCITGKVMDEAKHPIAHAQVVVYDRQTHSLLQTNTDGRGHFDAWPNRSSNVDIRVIPPVKSGFAQVKLGSVPAEEGKRLLISAKKGFELHGRVVHDGKPVRGAGIKISADDDTVHGGGEAVTNNHGEFTIVLTPGQKTMEITDPHTQPPSVIAQRSLSVSNDRQLQDIVITTDLAEHK